MLKYIHDSCDCQFVVQGTLSLEFLDQVPQLDALIVPISGGGLTSGRVIGAKAKNPAIRVFVAEPKGADDAAQSKSMWKTHKLEPVIRDLVDVVITAEDEEILEATRYRYRILKVVIEPSAAIGLVAVLSDNFKENLVSGCSQNVGIVLSGGNADLDVLFE
ncbi:putative ammonia-lyase, Serine racemase [Helianthus anomalus]